PDCRNPTFALSEVKQYILSVHKYMSGKKRGRKRDDNLTLSFAFSDPDGIRYPELSTSETPTPHVHCVTYVPPQHRILFETFIGAGTSNILGVQIRKAVADNASLEQMISYYAHGYPYISKRDVLVESLWMMFPR